MLTSTLKGARLNATVLATAPIQPPQAFVDYMIAYACQDNLVAYNFIFPNKGVTSAYGFIGNILIEDYFDTLAAPGVDLSGNALEQIDVDAIIQNASYPPAHPENSSGPSADATIDVSGGTSADPAEGALTEALWSHDSNWIIKVNIHGQPAVISPYVTEIIDPICDFRGTNMTTAEVNALLSFLVTNHLNDYDPELRLDGSGMGAPTGQGLTDKAALITAGWTVTTN